MLHYALFDRLVPVEPLRVLDTRQFCWKEWRITLYALATSHALTMERDDASLTELLTCAQLPDAPRMHLCARADTTGDFPISLPYLKGMLRLTPFALAQGEALSGRFAPECRFSVAYPQTPGMQTPHTHIGWRAEPEQLEIETIHTYPEEGKAVRSETRLMPLRAL
jgi:hypothetical protein